MSLSKRSRGSILYDALTTEVEARKTSPRSEFVPPPTYSVGVGFDRGSIWTCPPIDEGRVVRNGFIFWAGKFLVRRPTTIRVTTLRCTADRRAAAVPLSGGAGSVIA